MVEECRPWMHATGFAALKCLSVQVDFTSVCVSLHQRFVSSHERF